MTTRDISPGEHFNRDNPSKKYISLLEEYKVMHGHSDRMFNGRSLLKFVDIIKAYLEKNECQSVLDYGSGKGALYTEDFHTITKEINKPLPEYWDLDLCVMYDPAYEEHSTLPDRKFDAVISTDVLEHIPEADLGWVLREMYSKAEKMVFLNVACFPALKKLKDGSNAHVSIFSTEEWIQFVATTSIPFKDLKIYLFADNIDKEDGEFTVRGFKIESKPHVTELQGEPK
jgi:hypothetical protein